MDDFPTNSPANYYLIHSLTTQPNNQSPSPLLKQPHKTSPLPLNLTLSSFSVCALFLEELGSEEEMQQLHDQENQRGPYYSVYNLNRFTAKSNAQL